MLCYMLCYAMLDQSPVPISSPLSAKISFENPALYNPKSALHEICLSNLRGTELSWLVEHCFVRGPTNVPDGPSSSTVGHCWSIETSTRSQEPRVLPLTLAHPNPLMRSELEHAFSRSWRVPLFWIEHRLFGFSLTCRKTSFHNQRYDLTHEITSHHGWRTIEV